MKKFCNKCKREIKGAFEMVLQNGPNGFRRYPICNGCLKVNLENPRKVKPTEKLEVCDASV